MKKPGFLKRFTIIDIIIIICIIAALGFAIFHMTADNSDKIVSTSFDSSTNNKIIEKYLDYYKDGNIIKSKVVGTDSSTGEEIETEGNVLWIGNDEEGGVNILLEKNGEKILTGLYKDIHNADIYYNKISLETTGEKYHNLKEIKISPMKASSFDELVSKIPNGSNYEISADLTISQLDTLDYQKLTNKLKANKKPSIILNYGTNILSLNRANENDIKMANSIIKSFDGQTGEITLRIYDCNDETLKKIQDSYNVMGVADIS